MRQIANGEFLTRNYDRSSIGEKKFTLFLNKESKYGSLSSAVLLNKNISLLVANENPNVVDAVSVNT